MFPFLIRVFLFVFSFFNLCFLFFFVCVFFFVSFVWSISIRSRFSHILGFHLTSGKTKIKNFEFSSSSGKSQF